MIISSILLFFSDSFFHWKTRVIIKLSWLVDLLFFFLSCTAAVSPGWLIIAAPWTDCPLVAAVHVTGFVHFFQDLIVEIVAYLGIGFVSDAVAYLAWIILDVK